MSCFAFTITLRPQAPVERVPDFSLPDTFGRTATLRQFRGKVILLDFWATWCGPCQKEMPGYEDLYRRYKDRGLAVVGIALDSSPAQVRRFAQKYGITYPLLINGMDVSRYGALGIPTTILADRQGIVRKKVVGFEERTVFEDELKELYRHDRRCHQPVI